MCTQIIARLTGGITSVWGSRIIDMMSMLLSVSSMFMMYGISVSIRRALATQLSQERISEDVEDMVSEALFEQEEIKYTEQTEETKKNQNTNTGGGGG